MEISVAEPQISSPTSPLTGPVLANMLVGEDEFMEPVQLLRDLTAEQAVTPVPGYSYTLAQTLAHVHFWQHHNLAKIHGENPPDPAHLDDTWPEVRNEEWSGLVSGFLADLDTLIGLTEDDAGLVRETGEDETLADRIRYSAVHNAYHFGQIVLLRRLLGFWPPEGGENTW